MTRKRCHRRPVPVRPVPINFGFPADVKVKAMIQARSALAAVLDHTGDAVDVQTLLRIAMYCRSLCEQLARSGAVDADGMADAVEAVDEGGRATIAVSERLARTGRVGTDGPEREQLVRLVDAYEAIFNLATRRESVAAISSLPPPLPSEPC